jgi:macrolide-specific efflux system membrane fusion protein
MGQRWVNYRVCIARKNLHPGIFKFSPHLPCIITVSKCLVEGSTMSDHPKRRPARTRRFAIAALAAALLAGGGVAANNYFEKRSEAPLATVRVVKGDVEKTVTSLGKLKPRDYVDVGTQVSGQLRKVHVKIGDRVSKGDLIAEVDAKVYETRVRTDRANLDNLRAQLIQQQAEANLARQQATRNQALLKERAISEETVEQSLSALKVADARIAATQAQIRAAQATLDGDVASLGYTSIYTPMAGTVVSQTSLQGQTVNSAQQAPVIVRVADLETMTVWAQVAEADVVKIKAGIPAWFTTLGDSSRRWKGTVRQVLPTPETVNDVVLYNVLVDVDNRERVLMTDMTVQVFFVLAEARGVPVVPLNALQPARGKSAGVYEARVVTAQGIAPRMVEVGVSNRTTAAIVAGLAEGDEVVLPATEPATAKATAGARQRGAAMGPRL